MKRCNKLTEFAFRSTSVTDASVDTIIQSLSQTLIKVDCRNTISESVNLWKISSMPKLKVLNEDLHIASPYPFDIGHQEPSGFWEIKSKLRKYE